MGKAAPQGVSASGAPPAGDQANAVLTGAFTGIGPGAPFALRGPMNLAIWASVTTALTTAAGSLAATVGAGGTIAPGDAINSVNVPFGTTVGTIVGTAITMLIPPISLVGDIQFPAARITGLRNTTGLVGATIVSPFFPAGTTVTGITTAASVPPGANPGDGAGVYGVVTTSAAPLSGPTYKGPVPITFLRTANAITVTGADAAAVFTGAEIVYSGSVQVERSFDGCQTWLPCNVGNLGTLAQYNGGGPINITFGEPEKEVYYRLNCRTYVSGVINYRLSQTGGAAESLAIGPLSGG